MNPRLPRAIDEEARERVRRRLTSSLVVEAGAGTGKTRLLVERLMRLLAPGEAADTPGSQFEISQLVAITFTEKAAAELRDRIRRELETAVVTQENPPRRQHLQALQELDRAPISTIHSFAASLLRQRPVATGVDPDFQHLEPEEEQEILDRTLEEALTFPDDYRDRLLAEFRLNGGGFPDLRRLMDWLYQHQDMGEATGSPAGGELDTEFAELCYQAARMAGDARRHCLQPDDKALTAIEALAAAIPPQPDSLRVAARSWLEAALALDSRTGIKINWQDEELKAHKAKVAELKSWAESLLLNLNSELLARITAWATPLIQNVESQKQKRGLLSYDDLLLKAVRLLENEESRRHFQDRYARILIDEFQDTDPLQVQIALGVSGVPPRQWMGGEAVSLEPGRLCIIGDPKQSIYRFRRADPRIYRRAADIIRRTGEIVIISQNFRSARGIVDFANDLFGAVWEEFPNDGIPYLPIHADPGRPQLAPEPAVKLLSLTDSPAVFKKVPDLRRAEAMALTAAIRTAVDSEKWQVLEQRGAGEAAVRPAEYSDIAILMPTLSEVDIYTEALERKGIPCRIDGKKLLFQRQIVTDLTNCLAAIDNPADLLSVVGALRSPFFAVPDDELVEWRAGGGMDYRYVKQDTPSRVSEACSILKRLHQQVYDLNPDGLIDALLDATGGWQGLAALNDETDRLLVSRIREQAREAAGEGYCTLREFRRRLEASLETTESDEAPPMPPGARQVRIMTIHSAKGLEFPIVMLANLHRAKRKTPQVIADRMNGTLEMKLRDGWQTAGFARAAGAEADSQAAEEMRLLYVAATRARDHLVIPAFELEKPGGMAAFIHSYLEKKRAAGQMPEGGAYINVAAATAEAARPEAVPTGEGWMAELSSELALWGKERSERLETATGLLPRILQPSAHEAVIPEREVSPELGVGRAIGLGRALHRYMAECRPGAEVDLQLSAYLACSEGVAEERVIELVNRCLASPQWQAAISAPRMWREAPVAVIQNTAMLLGAIDLVWEDAGGGLNIADWKSGGRQAERHTGQMLDYAAALAAASGRKVATASLFYAAQDLTVDISLT